MANTPGGANADSGDLIQREGELIRQAEDQAKSGLAIDDDVFERWLDALDTDDAVPIPMPRIHRT